MSRYFTSIFFILFCFIAKGQSEPIDLQQKDTVEYKQEYGLRVGADISRLVFSFIDEDYTGLELVGDYRLTEKLYLAAELGNEEKTQTEGLGNTPLYNFTTSGSYIKLGVDMNTYENWFGMNNSIFIGGRYAIASYSQTLNEYSIFDSNRFFNPDGFLAGAQPGEEFSGLSASWLEFIFGIKAELFANIYVGMSARLGFLVTKEDDRFLNLWVPGFNKVTDGSNFGVSYNYSISYFLPFYKKAKKKKEKLPQEEEN
ncbi:hypothetical protein FVB32_17070 [Flagellimonas hymeniacidonis]|uniref:Outer membrane protein beta-barrel domain-containing protein n=1 Tax=Flagellimonas hymeniacidonis TaxID=2603628 RepID=A0A5C8V5F3_9FLAO|nr:DUF6048 family protein [Flagellimonas hymeniacidonis]TXN36259.1 hypothetical protein FVB32_17070 [Flagellimonas hymeniacidonis]